MANPRGRYGVLYRTVDVQDPDPGLFLDLVQGWQEPPEVRGRDVVVPSLAGRYVGNRVADRRLIILQGEIRGNGVTESDQRIHFDTLVESVRVLFEPTLAPGPLRITLPSGAVWSINARTLNYVWRKDVPGLYEGLNVEMESVDPNWVLVP